MKKWNLYSGIILALIGLFVIIFPAFWVKVVVILLGVGSVAYGIYGIKYTKAIFENTMYERTILIRSIASIVIGVMAVLFPLAIGNAAWSVMIWILIIYLILSAVLGFYAAALLKDTGIERKRYFLENLGLLAIAVVLILIGPTNLGTAILRLIGIAALLVGAGIIVYEFISKKNVEVVEVNTETEIRNDDVNNEEPSAE